MSEPFAILAGSALWPGAVLMATGARICVVPAFHVRVPEAAACMFSTSNQVPGPAFMNVELKQCLELLIIIIIIITIPMIVIISIIIIITVVILKDVVPERVVVPHNYNKSRILENLHYLISRKASRGWRGVS